MTTPQMAIHEIRLGALDRPGEANIVKPNSVFDCPGSELDFLRDAGACRDLTEEEAARLTPAKKAAEDDPEEAKRVALIAQAKELGIKGIRKDMTAETVQDRIDEFKTPTPE